MWQMNGKKEKRESEEFVTVKIRMEKREIVKRDVASEREWDLGYGKFEEREEKDNDWWSQTKFIGPKWAIYRIQMLDSKKKTKNK